MLPKLVSKKKIVSIQQKSVLERIWVDKKKHFSRILPILPKYLNLDAIGCCTPKITWNY